MTFSLHIGPHHTSLSLQISFGMQQTRVFLCSLKWWELLQKKKKKILYTHFSTYICKIYLKQRSAECYTWKWQCYKPIIKFPIYKFMFLQGMLWNNRFMAHGKGIINVDWISAVIKCAVWTRCRTSQPTVSTETLNKHCTRQMPRQKYFFTFLPFKGCTTSGSTGLIMECNNASSSK
jgi:hypothetical protein